VWQACDTKLHTDRCGHEPAWPQEALSDAPMRIEEMGFNVSAPHIHAAALEALDIREGDRQVCITYIREGDRLVCISYRAASFHAALLNFRRSRHKALFVL
jgi:hypothetical protein